MVRRAQSLKLNRGVPMTTGCRFERVFLVPALIKPATPLARCQSEDRTNPDSRDSSAYRRAVVVPRRGKITVCAIGEIGPCSSFGRLVPLPVMA